MTLWVGVRGHGMILQAGVRGHGMTFNGQGTIQSDRMGRATGGQGGFGKGQRDGVGTVHLDRV